MNKSRLLVRCAVSCLILLSACAFASAQKVSDRLLVQLPAVENSSPAEIVSVKVQGEDVRPGQYFSAGDEWLRGLTFTLKNVSDRAILWAGVELTFRDSINPNVRRVVYRVQYGSVPGRGGDTPAVKVLPGESFDVVVTDEDYRNLERIFPKAGLKLGVHRLEFRLEGAVAG